MFNITDVVKSINLSGINSSVGPTILDYTSDSFMPTSEMNLQIILHQCPQSNLRRTPTAVDPVHLIFTTGKSNFPFRII